MRLLILLAISISSASGANFTTYIGPARENHISSWVAALAVDSSGDTYVTGLDPEAGENAFVTKLDSAGNIVFTKTLASQCCSSGYAIAVDPQGNVWLGGNTYAPDFPLVNAMQSAFYPPTPNGGGAGSGFLVKMAPDGSILYSSFFGGVLGVTNVNAIAFDHNGNVYATGETDASDFPTTPGLPASPVSPTGPTSVSGAFVTKLDASGRRIIYSGVIAGSVCNLPKGTFCGYGYPPTAGSGIAVDGAGNALVAGNTDASDLPVTSGGPPGSGAFVLKVNAAGNKLAYLTYIGPPVGVINAVWTSTSFGTRPIAVDPEGNAYLAGATNSPEFATTPGAYQTAFILYPSGGADGFAIKLNPAGATVWSTLLGGNPYANAVSLDGSGNLWLTGGPSVFELSPDGSALPYSAQFTQEEAGTDIAIDPSGGVHVTGSMGFVSTITEGQPLAPRALSVVSAASNRLSGFIAPGEVISIYGTGLGPTTPAIAKPENGFFPKSLGGAQVLVNGSPIPLLYVSDSQINAEIPSPLSGSSNGIARVQVMNNSMPLPDFRVALASSDFAVFRKEGGSMAVINQDGTVNRITNPAKVGSFVSVWATGFGATGPPVDGAVATVANNYCGSCQFVLKYSGFNLPETVQYAGSSPGLIDGVMQINFMIPRQWTTDGAWVYFTPPGSTQPLSLGWVNISQ